MLSYTAGQWQLIRSSYKMGRKVFKTAPQSKSKLNFDEKPFVQQSSRPIGTDTFYTGCDDDGHFIENVHAIGDDAQSIYYADFDCMGNRSFVHEAMVQWSGAKRDTITAEIVNKLTTVQAGSNTNYNVDPGTGFVVPAAGNGTIAIVNEFLVEVTNDQDTGEPVMPGYWDCNFTSDGTAFDMGTLVPNLAGKGKYNMMTAEIVLARFVRKIPLMGTTSNWAILPSSDTAQLPIGTRLKMTFDTRGDDHDWEVSMALVMHREKLNV